MLKIFVVHQHKRDQRIRRNLMEPVHGFPWYKIEPIEESARGKATLAELARHIGKLVNSRKIITVPDLSHEYLYHLHEAKKAMDIGRYGLACHELKDVLHSREGISRQVLSNILALIQAYLEV